MLFYRTWTSGCFCVFIVRERHTKCMCWRCANAVRVYVYWFTNVILPILWFMVYRSRINWLHTGCMNVMPIVCFIGPTCFLCQTAHEFYGTLALYRSLQCCTNVTIQTMCFLGALTLYFTVHRNDIVFILFVLHNRLTYYVLSILTLETHLKIIPSDLNPKLPDVRQLFLTLMSKYETIMC